MGRCNLDRICFPRPLVAGVIIPMLSLSLTSCASHQIPFEGQARKANDAILAYQEGQRLEAEEKYEDALASYTLAIPYAKTRDAALYKVGRISALQEDWEQAEEAFESLLDDDPGNIAARQSLAYVYCLSGREGQGLEAYQALHEEKPHDESIFQGYIKALQLNGLEAEAQSAQAEYEALFPHLISK